jgi:threonyl-tRNA synthetase
MDNKNDHKKLGRELGLFTFSDTVGKGLPLWEPRGATLRRILERWVVDEELKAGYLHVYTPDIARLELYQKSGHYPYYKDSMYAPIDIEEEKFMLRPMTCPHHFELYLSKPHSYKELPMRFAELAKLYRFEKSGELMGLQRVRSFCLADAHIICRKNQAKDEINHVLDLIEKMAKVLGLKHSKDGKPGHYFYRLSLGDRTDTKKYYKDDAAWDHAENVLREILVERKANFVEASGEAAFYGPKIDIQMWNVNGKEDTAFTVQYDFVMPKRFELNYIDESGNQEQSVVVHRSSIGAIERVIAFLIEFYGGAFPTWLAPVQVAILPIADRHNDYCSKIVKELAIHGIRVEFDTRSETLGSKIRDHQMQKVPYMLVVGDREIEAGEVAVRSRDNGDLGQLALQKVLETIKIEVEEKIIAKTI